MVSAGVCMVLETPHWPPASWRNGRRQRARRQRIGAPAGVLVVDVERVGVPGNRRAVVQRGVIGDVEGLGVGRPDSCVAQAAKGGGAARRCVVEIEELAHLVVDEQLRVVGRDGQHHAGSVGVLLGKSVRDGVVDHQLARRAEVEIAAAAIHDHGVGHVRQPNGGPDGAVEQLDGDEILRKAGRSEPDVVADGAWGRDVDRIGGDGKSGAVASRAR